MKSRRCAHFIRAVVHVDRWQGRTWIQAQGNNAVAADYEMNVWTHLTLVYDDRQVCNAI